VSKLVYQIFSHDIITASKSPFGLSLIKSTLPSRIHRLWDEKTFDFFEIIGKNDSFTLIIRLRFNKPYIFLTMFLRNLFFIKIFFSIWLNFSTKSLYSISFLWACNLNNFFFLHERCWYYIMNMAWLIN